MSPCHHIVTGLNNTYDCLKCLYCEYSVNHGDSAEHGDSADHGGNANHSDSAVPTMHKQCCMQKQDRTNI